MNKQWLTASAVLILAFAILPVTLISDVTDACEPAATYIGEDQDDTPSPRARTNGIIVICIFLAFMVAALVLVLRFRTKEEGWRLSVFSRRRNLGGGRKP